MSPPGVPGHARTVTTTDGRRLRLMIGGAGDDLVLLEAGLGASGVVWGPVHELVGRHARVVAYDRAGMGGSDPDPALRDLARLADDLETVIRALPHRRLVLAGHSWGGPVVREVAARRLARGEPIAGVVLVDPSDENADLYFTRLAGFSFRAQAALLAPLARMGLLAPLNRMMTAGLPPELHDAAVRATSSVRAARATAAEQRHVIPGLRALREAPRALPGVRVRVISGARSGPLGRASRAALIRAHRATAAASEHGAHVSATRSEHMVPVTEPELVAAQILEVLAPATPSAEG